VAHLATVPDPRDRRGVRHRLASLLSVAVCAVLAGARSLAAIGEWAADAPAEVLTALGVRVDPLTGAVRPPDESTVRRVLVGIDGDVLDAAVGAWLAGLSPVPAPPVAEPPTPRDPWPAVAVDGKTLRGSGDQTARPVHLLAAMRHDTTAVLGQVAVDGKSNEITAFRPLLTGLELTRTVVTADALCRRRHNASYGDLRVMPTSPSGVVLGGVVMDGEVGIIGS
jgi:hypothetical protein